MARNGQRRARGAAVVSLIAAVGLGVAIPGQAAQAPRIVGGSAVAHPWPAMAQLYWGPRFECGGILLAPRWVLTAGHCVTSILGAILPPGDIRIRLGSSTLYDGTLHTVARIRRQPKFNALTAAYDAALVELAEPAAEAPMAVVGPGDESFLAPGDLARVLGWGATVETGDITPFLRQADVRIVSDSDCHTAYGSDVKDSVMLCAGYREGGIDACQGDSGGPLMVYTGPAGAGEGSSDGWKVAGLVSWGDGCAEKNKYGVYTELMNTSIQSWIRSTIGAGGDGSATPPPLPAPLIASFKVSGTKRAGKTLTFTSTSTPAGQIIAFEWDLDGDGAFDDATGKHAKTKFKLAGPQVVRLRVTGSQGAEATAEQTLKIARKK